MYKVARKKLERTGDLYIPHGTKSFIKLSKEQAQKVSAQKVSKWLATGRAVKGSSGSDEEVLRALLRYKER